MIACGGDWRPLVFPSGKFPEESYWFFNEPAETLYTLVLAYPHVDSALRTAMRERVDGWISPGGPLAGGVGQRTHELRAGRVRSACDELPEKLVGIEQGILRGDAEGAVRFASQYSDTSGKRPQKTRKTQKEKASKYSVWSVYCVVETSNEVSLSC